jgi:Zn-dependent M28 family amino/carboxypeptidase
MFFVFFTAEEGGGQGSYHFVDNFPFPLKDLKLAINVDMVGRKSEPFPDSVLAIPPDNMKLKLSEFVKKANTDVSRVSLKTYLDTDDLGGYYGGSDEVMFFLRGIPAILITNGYSHPDYHKPSDEAEKINFTRVSEASRLIYALAITAANAEKLF